MALTASEFASTRWTLVLSAKNPEDAQALEELCSAYWRPLYSYVRWRGYGQHDAQDLTQEFFSRLLAKKWVARADRGKGRFRTFLLIALKRFLANEWDRARSLKRGGGATFLPLDFDGAESDYSAAVVDCVTPERAFGRRWAISLLERVLSLLEAEQVAKGKAILFTALKPCLAGDRESMPYSELSGRLEMSEGAVKVAVHRLRLRYRELLREEVSHTVVDRAEVDAEMGSVSACARARG